MYIQMWFVNGG